MEKRIVPIAHIKTPFNDKFGIPRQSGMVDNIISEIIFEPEFRSLDAVRGLSDFSHIWVLWEFTGFDTKWSPTVRPPRLGGNTRMGVFATRSPNRPNSIGMSSLRLLDIDTTSPLAPILRVSGADILNGTAIYDVKPYIPFTDSHPDATSGFAGEHISDKLKVNFQRELAPELSEESYRSIIEILSLDPRPSYQDDPNRIYGLAIFGYDVKFKVSGETLTVIKTERL